jgi:4-amino-4-deoxy-L-arabinose transferase-like glycosyltransferase
MKNDHGRDQTLIWQMMILVLGWGLLYLPGLGTRELQGEEARRVLPGRTMLQTGDWVVPRSAGEIYNRKPPLVNWATAGAITLTGKMDEWTVRLPSVLVMLALALTVLLAGRPWLGKEGAFLAACVCLTNVGFIGKGRLAEIEALYIALFGMGLMVWLGAWWKERGWLAWVGSMLILGVGFLAKGPVHLWYFYAIIIGVLWAEGRLKELLTLRHGVGLAAFVAVWLPWALENSARNPQKDSGKVWLDQVTHRIGLVEFDWVNWLLQVPQSVFNFVPWAVLLPLAWSKVVTEQWPSLGRRGLWLKGLRAGLLVGFLVIALLPSSRPRFMVPLNLAAGLLVVECFALLPVDQRQLWVRRWLLVLAVVGGVAGIGCLAGAGWFASQVALSWAWIALVAVGLVVACRWVWRLRRESLGSMTKLGLAHLAVMGLGVALMGVTLAPVSTLRDDIRPFAREILGHTGEAPALVLYKLEPRMWPFYLGMTCREVADLDELPAQAQWVMVKAEDIEIRRKEMVRRYGVLVKEVPIQEPVTGNAGGDGQRYVLMQFAGR